MPQKPTYKDLEQRIRELEAENRALSRSKAIEVSGITIEWDTKSGTCSFNGLPVAMMWINTTLSSLMSGAHSMVGTKRFSLALQSEGRKSVEDDWKVISQFPNFEEGFRAIANIAAVAGWGNWRIVSIDEVQKTCVFQVWNSWEGRYQKSQSVIWGSGMLAGKLAGYCSKLFTTNCWADQLKFIAQGDPVDEFIVKPSNRTIEKEIDNLLTADEATRADMAVVIEKLKKEAVEKDKAERALRLSEEKFFKAFQNAPFLMTISTVEDGRCLDLNDAFTRVTGYSREKAVGSTAVELGLISGDDRARLEEHLQCEGRVRDMEIEAKRSDGTKLVCLYSGELIEIEGRQRLLSIASDITEHRQTMDALKESERKYRLLADNVTDVIWLMGMDLKFIYTSPSVKKLRGYSPEEAMHISLENTFTPSSYQKVIQLFSEELARDGRPGVLPERTVLLELDMLCKDGGVVPVEIGASFMRDENGSPNGIIGITRDLSERRQAERKVRDSEARFRAILDRVDNIPVQGYNSERTVIYWNTASERVYGYSKDEAIGRKLEDLIIPEELRQEVIDDIAGWVDGGAQTPAGELVLCNKNRDPVHVYSSHVLHQNASGEKEMYCIDIDLSQLRHAEGELQDSEQRYRSLVENTMDGFFICRIPSGKFIFLNKRICKIFGYTIQEGLELSVWDVMSPADHARIQKRIQERLQGYEMPNERQTYTAVRKDGSAFRAEISTSLVSYSGEHAVQGLLRDVTEQENLQQQLQQAQKMEAIGTLAGGIAHDFNNILSAILGYSELALTEMAPESTTRMKLEAIQKSGMRARELVSQILAFSRRGEQTRSPIELRLIIKEALKILRPAIPTTIDIQTEINSECRILGDPSQIHQVLMNLCTNAYQAMIETGGTLGISISKERIEGELSHRVGVPAGDYARMVISDTGVGISNENMMRIFEPYFTTKEKSKGTGLGLAVVHGIVKSHNGNLLVESQIGKGTSFKVYLPLTQAIIDDAQESKTQLKGGNERILLIDDVHDVLEVETEMLEKLGYHTESFDKVYEALNAFKLHPNQYDLIITDMTMPKMTGDKLAFELRKIRPDIPVILITGFSELITQEKAESIGINGFLMKPVDHFEMATMVRNVLDQTASKTENLP